MTALEIIQEAAKRLCIMIPASVVPPEDQNSSAIDYDANLLVTALNSTIRQMMTLHALPFNSKLVSYDFPGIVTNKPIEFNLATMNRYEQVDFIFKLDNTLPDYEGIDGDGFVVCTFGDGKPQKEYLFRELTAPDMLRIAKLDTQPDEFYQDDPITAIEKYKKNLPSEDKSSVRNSDNVESGFYILEMQAKKVVYFVNNMISYDDLVEMTLGIPQATLNFIYKTNYGVYNLTTNKDRVTKDTDELKIPDELAILSTVINYKSYYGLDYALELGQQKAYMDTLKKNHENVQVTRTTKKHYYMDN